MDTFSVLNLHYSLGYGLLVLVLLETVWSLVETISETEQSKLSNIKSKIIVGLIDLQVLLGLVNVYLNYSLQRAVLHAASMLAAVGVLHVANKKSGWVRVGLQGAGTVLIVMGIGFVHMLK